MYEVNPYDSQTAGERGDALPFPLRAAWCVLKKPKRKEQEMYISQKRHIMKEWQEYARKTLPCIETAAGEVIYFQLAETNGGLVWQYGSACNVGLLVNGEFAYDEDASLYRNIEVALEIINERSIENGR